MNNLNNKINNRFNNNIKNDGFELPLEDFLSAMGIEGEENFQLPDPNLLQYYYDRKDRIIWLTKDVDDSLFNEIKLITYWNRKDKLNNIPVKERKPIRIYIHSYGGNLDTCFALLDVMKLSKTPIYTYNMNSCMSAGALIYISSNKRFAMPSSIVLFHQGTGGAGGQFDQVVKQTDNYKKLIAMLKEHILNSTKIPKALLSKKFNTEWYIYLEDQIKYGITDEIITDIDVLGE